MDLLPHLDRLNDPVFVAVVSESIEAAYELADLRNRQAKARGV